MALLRLADANEVGRAVRKVLARGREGVGLDRASEEGRFVGGVEDCMAMRDVRCVATGVRWRRGESALCMCGRV